MILVTGGTGFIGSAFVRKLATSGRSVKILARDPAKAGKLRGVKVVEGDILEPLSLKKALKDVEVVAHLAGLVSYTKPRGELFKVNAVGTRNLLEACRWVRRFVFASTISVYGKRKGMVDEKTPAKPFNHYGASKLAAEDMVKGSGLKYVILRFAPVYGAGSPHWEDNLRLLDKGFPVPDVNRRTHILSVGNAVQALMLALDGPPGIYNIADAGPVNFTEFAEMLVRLLGKEPKRLPLWLARLGAFAGGLGPYLDVLVQERHYDITAAREKLGYRPADDLETEARKMVEWYKLKVNGL